MWYFTSFFFKYPVVFMQKMFLFLSDKFRRFTFWRVSAYFSVSV